MIKILTTCSVFLQICSFQNFFQEEKKNAATSSMELSNEKKEKSKAPNQKKNLDPQLDLEGVTSSAAESQNKEKENTLLPKQAATSSMELSNEKKEKSKAPNQKKNAATSSMKLSNEKKEKSKAPDQKKNAATSSMKSSNEEKEKSKAANQKENIDPQLDLEGVASSAAESQNKEKENTLLPKQEDHFHPHPSSLGSEKKNFHFHLYSELLYFKMTEDAIKYAEKFPQNSTITPKVSEINQEFSYSPGIRVGIGIPAYLHQWEIGAEWTYLYSHPSTRHSDAKEFGILASLVIPTWGAFGNNAVEHVRGNWHLTFNSVDINLQRKFHPEKRIYLTAWGGVLAGFIDQKMWAHYRDFRIDFTEVTTPRKVVSHGSMYSVGPYIGVNLDYQLPKKFDLFFKYSIGLLGGMYSVKTEYKDFSQSPEEARVNLKDSYTRTFTAQQMQAGVSKEWSSDSCEFVLALGWEFQQWTHQMRMRWLNSFTQSQDPEDLSFYGPFLRISFRF